MIHSDSPYVVDWYVVSLRWFVLLGTTVSLSLTNSLVMPGSIVLLALTCWNIYLMGMAGQNRRVSHHREVCVGVDLGVGAVYFCLAGGLVSPAFWVLLLPMISTSFYYNFKGGVLAAGLMSVIEIAYGLLFINNPLLVIGGVFITMILGTLFGYISQQTYNQIQQKRLNQITQREKQQRVETDRLRAIYNMTSSLSSMLSYKHVLEAALDLSISALQVEDSTAVQAAAPVEANYISAFLLFKGNELVVGSARRFSQVDLRATFPAKQGILAKIIEEGEPMLTVNTSKDPELGRLIALSQCNSVYCLPMRSGINTYGAMIFGHLTPNYFTRERCDVLGIVGRQAVIAIQNARLYQDLADEKERMQDAQEEARKKLARDLHDGPTQSVSAIAMRVSLARRMLDRDPSAVAEELAKIEDLARRTTKEIRHMLFTLRPLVLETQGLVAALQSNAEKMKETYNQDVSIQVDSQLATQIEMGKSGVIFYIAEEAINNARKHAKAATIWVRLNPLPKHPEIAFLEISDNGVGFDVAEVDKSYDKRGSLGMVNLRERAELVNGILNIQSAPGKGTKIQVFIPLTEDAADLLHNARDGQKNQSVN